MALDVVTLARSLIDIDSTTGREAEVGRWIADFLRARGWTVREQRVSSDRHNVMANVVAPRVVLSTHMDCVPPFFPSRIEAGRLYGRGACDAKGILAAQIVAAERLRGRGETRAGLLVLVGEERGSDGARAANDDPHPGEFLINGEPTDGRLAIATRGVLRVRLRAAGRAAHSSYPDRGESAIDKLVDALVALRAVNLPEDPALGRTHYSVGLISGGIAPNVIAPSADAEVVFRTVGDAVHVRQRLEAIEPYVTIEDVIEVPPVRMLTLPDYETAVFPFTTDVPFLDRWGQPLLFGPGSALVAHTDHEHVDVSELERAVDSYVEIVGRLLSQPPRSAA